MCSPESVKLGFSIARFGGDNGWGYNHSDKREGDEQIMHWGSLQWSSSVLLHTLIIVRVGKFLNPTKTARVIESVLPLPPLSCYETSGTTGDYRFETVPDLVFNRCPCHFSAIQTR
jgi:hypothetical protein